MRNLRLLTSVQHKFSKLGDVLGSCDLTVNYDTGTIYVAASDKITGFCPSSGQVESELRITSVPDQKAGSSYVAIQHLPEDCSVCIAVSTGDLLLWNLETLQVECVGSVESGITAMEWSPDSEILVITTGVGTYIMMSRDFDPIQETTLHPDTTGEATPVQVGWGKKETQFHGSVGKQAATAKPEMAGKAMDWDDRQPRITWRADGQYFAISSIHPNSGARQVCVWSREGVHFSTSENVDGIEQALSWRPNGSLLATSQRRPNKHDIAFFEKNGLRHGEFTLPFDVAQVKVVEVTWNLDSSVLAVWCEALQQPGCSYVQLWTTGNYHWYLKQSLPFSATDGKVACVRWDPEHEYRLHVITCPAEKVSGEWGYHRYTWAWSVDISRGTTKDDQAIVAVIDGANVLMTPTRAMVVPPPMCAYRLQLPAAVNHVIFAPPSLHSNDLAVVMDDNRVAIYRFEGNTPEAGVKIEAAGGNGFKNCCPFPTLKGIYSIEGVSSHTKCPLAMSHFLWLSDDVMIMTTVTIATQPHSIIHQILVDGEKLRVIESTRVESQVYSIAADPMSNKVAVQLVNGSVLQYIVDDAMLLPWETSNGEEVQFPVPCMQMVVCSLGDEVVVLGLTQRYRLYANSQEICSNCTSISVHDEYLLLTTLQHTCRCISRHVKVKDLPTLSDGKAHPYDESIRRVERGSLIVRSVPEDTRLVLQMPRGNLETIHPRALVLAAVRKLLDRLEFGEAFTLMKKHRVNMNLLYDHCPATFLDNVSTFVRQVAMVNHINIFLTDLVEEDVTVTMYTAAYERNKVGAAGTQPVGGAVQTFGKVDTVCDAVRQALIQIDENKYLLSILTTYVKKSQAELELALHLVKKLRDCANDMPHISAEEALKYLLFLVDVNELYDIALGTYDFDLVLMVAEKSQKDPKEYIPFMNELRRLETNYQRYTIDKYLKRYGKALEHIVKCGPDVFPECVQLINDYNLHSQALQLYLPASTQYKEIASCYGDLLSSKRRHDEAAILYAKGENWERALESYQSCHQWEQVFCMTARLGYSSNQEAEIARKLAEEFASRSRYREASVVLEQYASDIEEAIVTLLKGGLWDEALRMMYRYKRTDFIETDLKPQLLEALDVHTSSLDQMRETFEKQRARLVVVRIEKQKARLELIESGGVQDSDLFSDTSSATGESVQSTGTSSSVYSKMSGRSTKNRRKAEHKKWKLREGSEYEDFALIAALAKTVQYVDGLRDEMRALIRALVLFHYDVQAEGLQRQYDSFLALIDKAIPEIWLDEEETRDFRPVLGPTMTANAIALAMQQGQAIQTPASEEEKLDPIIRVAPVLQKDKKWKLYTFNT